MLSTTAAVSGTAQGDFELTWTETREELTLIPAMDGGDTLTNFELALVTRPTPDTLRMVTGYSAATGLYDEMHLLNPERNDREAWQDPLPAYHRMDVTGSVMEDAAGRTLLEAGPSDLDREEYAQLEALARSGRLTPFVKEIIPAPEEAAMLSAQGYRVEVREPAVAARTIEEPDGKFWGEQLVATEPSLGEDRRVFYAERPNERIVADAGNLSISSYTFADSANTVPTAVEVRFLRPATDLGGVGYYETLVIEAREDLLPTGRSVERTKVTRRGNHKYAGPGHEVQEAITSSEPFGSVANPLRAGQLLVAVPSAHRESFRITLADVSGRLHVQRPFVDLRTALLPLELPSDLAAGAYVLSIHSDRETLSQQLIIE